MSDHQNVQIVPVTAPSSKNSVAVLPQNWEPFYAELQGFARSRVSSQAEADDIVQDAFLRAHRAKAEGQDVDDARAWLYRVVRNLISDTFRRSQRQQKLSDALLHESEATPHNEGGEESVDSQVSALLARALPLFIDGLDERYAQALRLVDLQGLSQLEAAESVSVSLSCMKARVRRGRARLLSALEDCCAFQVDSRGKIVDWQRKNSGRCGCSS